MMVFFMNYLSEELWVMFVYFLSNFGKVMMILIVVVIVIVGVGILLLIENFVKNDKKVVVCLVVNNL